MTKYPFRAVVFTSDVSSHYLPGDDGGTIWADFAIDLNSITCAKNPVVVDYNHDDGEIIGAATINVEAGQILAVGELVSASPNDRAASIAEIGREVPFGISPTLDLNAAERVDVPDGEVFTANGREYIGPVSIYKNASLLGISVCPYPTDEKTNLTLLQKGRIVQMTKLNLEPQDDVQKNDAVEIGDDAGVNGNGPEVKNQELQEYVDRFGLERGFEYYQSGLTLEEAAAKEYEHTIQENAELKAKLAKFEADAAEEDEAVEESEDETAKMNCGEEKEEAAKLLKTLKRIESRLAKFEDDMTKLSRRGDALGLSAGRRQSANSAARSYKDAFCKTIQK